MRTIRLFVSSPGDVEAERKRVEFVAERLNGLFAGVARFETIRWETKFYAAHKSFQPQIPEASDCDIVIGIFWARLGSELPADFPRMPGDEPFPSGTAYEILSAIRKRQELEAAQAAAQAGPNPDVYVFQKQTPPFPPPRDEKDMALLDTQWRLLKGFFERWLRRPDGQFVAAFHTFQTTDDFEQQIEKLLRGWLAEHVLGGRAVMWPIDTKGSPFRGLEVFDAAHTSVFFGRARDVTRATDRLRTAAAPSLSSDENTAPAANPSAEPAGAPAAGKAGTAFLLVVGSSGAGKSSLVRAGVVPRLTTPGVVKEVDLWRVAVMRPSDGLGPIEALATALFAPAAPGQGGAAAAALPELAEGDNRLPEELARHLRGESAVAIRPIERALERVSAAERARGAFTRDVRVDLLLVVDQLDDLFADDVAEADRTKFAELLAALVATGRVWVIATLRAALYESFLTQGAFKALKDAGSTYDLAPPGAAELAEIVGKPAEAAGLVFERAADGVALDERLLADAAGSDTLPLLQFTLQRLFEQRESVGEEIRLTFAAYAKLGGIDGAIDQAAEDALARLTPAEQEALPRLLRQLVAPIQDTGAAAGRASVTVRAVPLDEAAPDAATRALVNALVGARILTTATEGGVATVRIAHQRVLESWKRAQEIVRSNADFFRVRGEIEDQRRRWLARARKSELLLSSGLPLAEAEAMVGRYRNELSPEVRDYVAASGRRARLRQRLTGVAAVVFAAVAVLAIISWRQAQSNLDAAQAAIAALVETTSEVVLPIAQLDTVEALIDQARDALNRFSSMSEDPRITGQRARTLLLLAETDWERGNIDRMRGEAEQAVALLDKLAGGGDLEFRLLRARSERLIGLAYTDANDKEPARQHYEKGIAELTDMLKLKVGEDVSWQWLRSLADLNQELGDLYLKKYNDTKDALASFVSCYDERKHLEEEGHDGPAFEQDIAWAANKHGDVEVRLGDDDEALKWFTAAHDRIAGLGDDLWDNVTWPDHLALIDDNIGLIFVRREGFEDASKSFAKAQSTLERGVKRDAKNLFRREALSWTDYNLGTAQFQWALKTGDKQVLAQAVETFAATAAQYADITKEAPHKIPWQLGLNGARASWIAADAMTKLWADDARGAAAGFATAADLMVTNFLPQISQLPRPDFVAATVDFLDWAGVAAAKAGAGADAQKRFKQALDTAQQYRAILGERDFTAFEHRIQAHLDGAKT